LMGHRRLAGLVSEATIGGASLVRIDVYLPGEEAPVATQFYGPPAIYAITPMAEDLARRFAVANKPQPVTRYDLPALEPPRRRPPYVGVDDEDQPDEEDESGDDEPARDIPF
jgi:hypothetical protein